MEIVFYFFSLFIIFQMLYYLPLQKDKNSVYFVLIAKSPAELVQEGSALHHCVGKMGYDRKFVKEETLIFFIRSAEAPDVPLVTMEYSLKSNKILQIYANGNTRPADEVQTFIQKNGCLMQDVS